MVEGLAIDIRHLDEAERYTEKKSGERTGNESTSSCEEDDVTILAWEIDDPENPYNFSKPRKNYIILVSVICILNSTLGSSLPSNVVPKLSEEWNVESTYQKILPISVYIIGKCCTSQRHLSLMLMLHTHAGYVMGKSRLTQAIMEPTHSRPKVQYALPRLLNSTADRE